MNHAVTTLTWTYSPHEAKKLLVLATPILFAQFAQVLMYFSDTVMSGRVSSMDLAAVGVAGSFWSPVVFSLQALILAITPMIAKNQGELSHSEVPKTVQMGYLLAVLCAVGIVISFQFVDRVYALLDMPDDMRAESLQYLGFCLWGIFPQLLFTVQRGFAEGLGLTRPAMFISFVGITLNVPANYLFIYGAFGMEGFGGAGCGLATSVVNWGMFFAMIWYTQKQKKMCAYHTMRQWQGFASERFAEIFKTGIPMAFAMFFEVSLFAVIPTLLTPFGATEIAGHQTASSFSVLIFMLPLSLSIAVAIRVGYLSGKRDAQGLRSLVFTSLTIAVAMSMGVAIVNYLVRHHVPMLYSTEADVIALAASILALASIYQISDAIQVISNGILRGLKETSIIFYCTFIAYWPIGMGLGYTLARTDLIVAPMGARGFWIGIIAGLTFAAIGLGSRAVATVRSRTLTM